MQQQQSSCTHSLRSCAQILSPLLLTVTPHNTTTRLCLEEQVKKKQESTSVERNGNFSHRSKHSSTFSFSGQPAALLSLPLTDRAKTLSLAEPSLLSFIFSLFCPIIRIPSACTLLSVLDLFSSLLENNTCSQRLRVNDVEYMIPLQPSVS